MFSIFDIGNTGTINPKDFLLTMLAFKPEDESSPSKGNGEEAARLYFNIFVSSVCIYGLSLWLGVDGCAGYQ